MTNRLKELRLELGLSQPDMAEHVGLCFQSYRKLEQDLTSYNPSLKSVLKIANKLGISVDYLLDRQTEFAVLPDYVESWNKQFIARIDLLENRQPVDNMKSIAEKATITKYPYNLLSMIFGYNDMYETSAISEPFFAQLEKIIEQLPARERQILHERYLIGNTLENIAKKHNVSRQRIQQLLDRALFQIREQLTPFLFDPANKVEKLIKQANQLETQCRVFDDEHLTDPIYNVLGRSVRDIHFSTRTTNVLITVGCYNLIDVLLLIAHKDIRAIPNLGETSQQEIYDYLAKNKLLPDSINHKYKIIQHLVQEKLYKLNSFGVYKSKHKVVVDTINQIRLIESEHDLHNEEIIDYDPESIYHKQHIKYYSNNTTVHEYKL